MNKKNAQIQPGDRVAPLRDLKPHVFEQQTYKVLDTKIVRGRDKEGLLFMKLEVRHICQCMNAWWPFAYFRLVDPRVKRGQTVHTFDTACTMMGRGDETSGVGVQGQGMAHDLRVDA